MGNYSGIFVLALMVGVFYLIAIRPQQRRLKQHQALVSSIEPGDDVITVGGVFGTVDRMDEISIWVKVADNTTIRFSRQAISRKVQEETESAGSDGLDHAGDDGADSGPSV
ncbi:MAG: preprotein translocase subunit YajC [Actinobacteria bacterium]|nr:preprotein translocase subunit YajC [Actinomycetota bacterium]